MGLIAAKCTSCGSNITVDESKEAGICSFCNTAFITEKAVTNYNTTYQSTTNISTTQNIVKNIYGSEKNEAEDFIRSGESYLSLGMNEKARESFTKALDLNPVDWNAWMGILKLDIIKFGIESFLRVHNDGGGFFFRKLYRMSFEKIYLKDQSEYKILNRNGKLCHFNLTTVDKVYKVANDEQKKTTIRFMQEQLNLYGKQFDEAADEEDERIEAIKKAQAEAIAEKKRAKAEELRQKVTELERAKADQLKTVIEKKSAKKVVAICLVIFLVLQAATIAGIFLWKPGLVLFVMQALISTITFAIISHNKHKTINNKNSDTFFKAVFIIIGIAVIVMAMVLGDGSVLY